MNKLRQIQAIGAIDAVLKHLDPDDASAVLDFLASAESVAELSDRLDEIEVALSASEEPPRTKTKYLGD